MMHEFLSENRKDLIDRCRVKVAQRTAPKPTEEELKDGIPLFLDQLITTLRLEQAGDPMLGRKVSGPASGAKAESESSEMGQTAARHGEDLLRRGFTVEQVVHDYGDLCQAITDLAVERGTPFEMDEFRTLNRCLDNGIAVAVGKFIHQRDFVLANKQAIAENERLGFFAHELRNLLNSATLALTVIKEGKVSLNGATAGVLDRSMVGIRSLIDRSLSEVRMTAGMPLQHRLFSLADFIAEARLSASLEATVKECVLSVSDVDPQLAVEADRDLLSSAVGNLLQNAFKFTRPHSEVTLTAYAVVDRILIEVQDHCGGLAAGDAEKMFLPFTQSGEDKTGLGLGLSIARRSVELQKGTLSVRDVPASGCLFTIDLPRYSMPKVFSASSAAV